MTKLLSVPTSLSDLDNLVIWSIQFMSDLFFKSAIFAYLIQLFGIFQLKLTCPVWTLTSTSATQRMRRERINHTVEKSQTNAASVTMPHLMHTIWWYILKRTVEKSQTNAITVTLHPIMQALWGYIWKRTVEKSQINATNVTLHLLASRFKDTF